jgi:dTDP-4-amino-4,6-dideoxygalactose transaminase
MDDSRPVDSTAGVRSQAQAFLYFDRGFQLDEREESQDFDLPNEIIPVLRPQLPNASDLLPYIRRIDEARVYSNFGQLAVELEQRLTEHLKLPAGGFASAGSGTTALVGAILATAGRATAERPFAVVPAFTFIATALAVEQCGYRVYLADVDAATWMLEPNRILALPELDQIGLVVPVAPFGRPVPQAPWKDFRDRTGISIVIDGAAGFEGLAANPDRFLGEIPVTLSFHATKSFGTGEGGGVASTDGLLVERIGTVSNFGFWEARNSHIGGLNGKMSEYHAAVGLAELDGWSEKRQCLRNVADQYRKTLTSRPSRS